MITDRACIVINRLEGREAPVCRRRLCGTFRDGALLHRRVAEHAPAIVAFAAPTTNSYKRLVPGFEAPVNLAYSARNRSAAVRIPMFSTNPKQKRLEFRPPDPSCNAYLAVFGDAARRAGRDPEPDRSGRAPDKDIYDLSPGGSQGCPIITRIVGRIIESARSRRCFLLKGDVFTPQIIDRWITYKREKEIQPLRMRPHPLEFQMYFDI